MSESNEQIPGQTSLDDFVTVNSSGEKVLTMSSLLDMEYKTRAGLDGTPLKVGQFGIQSNGRPGVAPVGVPVKGRPWVESGGTGPAAPSLDELSAYQHPYFKVDFHTIDDSAELEQPESRPEADLAEATTWSSELLDEHGKRTGWHTVMLDIDHPARLVPSSRPGHYHLYIDHPMPQGDYFKLLEVMVEVGLVQEGYRNASVARGGTHLRLPWVKKKHVNVKDVHKHPAGAIVVEFDDAPSPDAFAVAPGTDVEALVDRADSIDQTREAEAAERLERARTTLNSHDPAELTWDVEEYRVEYVDGKGVLRRRREVKPQHPEA
jgi:hypothetical protein